jgi:hypothetical protein
MSEIVMKNLDYLHSHNPSKILFSARLELGIRVEDIVSVLERSGVRIPAERYRLLETDSMQVELLSASQWFQICRAIHLSPEVVTYGYSRILHLNVVSRAIEEGTFNFLVSERLLNALDELKVHFFEAAKSDISWIG